MTNLYPLKLVTCLFTLFLSLQVALPACIGQSSAIADTTVPFPSWSLGLGVGITTLPSLQATYRAQKRWAIRAEYDYMSYNKTDWILANGKMSLDVRVRMSRWVLLGHYMPFRTERFGILAGLAFFPTKTLTTTAQLAQNIKVSNFVFTPAAVGTGLLELGYQQSFAPYIGITLGRPVPVHKSSWRMDIGTYYGGAFQLKELTIDSKIFLPENELNIGILERNLNRLPLFYRLIPDVKVVWVYRL